jgi:hypothetical protein
MVEGNRLPLLAWENQIWYVTQWEGFYPQPMRKRWRSLEHRKPEDYMEAADNALELAKVLAGQGGISN